MKFFTEIGHFSPKISVKSKPPRLFFFLGLVKSRTSTFDEMRGISRRLAGDKSAGQQPTADSLASLNLLKGIFAPGSREANQITALQKSSSKNLLAGIAAMNGPRGGQLQELFGDASFQSASLLGQLIEQRESQRIYEHTMNTCLDPQMRTRLGFDKPGARATNLNRFIQPI